MPQSDTVERILDAAEQLFADHGFAETSLRAITSHAGVNLAAVNYHFGSKKVLIQAVFSRFLDPFAGNLDRALDNLDEQHPLELEDSLHLLVDQILKVKPRNSDDLSLCMRLIGLAYNQGQGHLKTYLYETYGKVFERYLKLLLHSCPQISAGELFWRVNFILGAAVFTLSGINALQAMAVSDYDDDAGVEDVLRKMVPFMAAGLRKN